MTTISVPKPTIMKNEVNNVYYNIRIVKKLQDRFTPAVYSVNRVSPIIDVPNDYELAVVRFSIPASNIPIMVWGNSPYDSKTNPSSKVDKLSITLSYDGLDVTEILQFIPNTIGNDIYGNTIWNYQEFIDIINVALDNAFTTLKTAKPLAPPTEAPYMTFNAQSELCSLYAQQLYDTTTTTILIYFNNPLYQFFPSFQAFGLDPSLPKAYQILVKDNKNNTPISPVGYYVMLQEYTTLSLWNDFTTIVFETDTLPVEPEFQPSQNDTTRRIITDFEPLADINNRQAFQYFGSGWKRYYDLKSAYPLSSVDIKVYWEDRDGKLYPVYLGVDEALTMKILFRRKIGLQLEQAFYSGDDE